MKRPILVFGVIILVLAFLAGAMAFASGQGGTVPEQISGGTTKDLLGSEIFIHVGSPLILSQGEISPLDPNNLDVAATIVTDRTLVPLRALSEYFKAVVLYDEAERKAIIDFDGKRFFFPIDEGKYTVLEGKSEREVIMDTKTMILNDRTMVPLRVICEEILGRKVSYYDKVIAISDNEMNLQENKTLINDVKSKIGLALKVQSMDDLKSAMLQGSQYNGGIVKTADDKASLSNTATAPTSAAKSESHDTTNSGAGFSTTNIQVQGIDEADIVKTDGKNIYIAGNNAVRIVSADKGKLDDKGVIKLPQNKVVREIYIDGNRLVLIGNRSERFETNTVPDKGIVPAIDTISSSKMIMPPYYSKRFSFIDVYDISNSQSPVFVKGHEMEGNYQSSRKNGDVVYLITNTYVYDNIILPMMRDTTINNEASPILLKDIMTMPGYPSSGYVIVSAVDINNNEKTQVEAIATSSHLTYMSNSALYLTANDSDGLTAITKFKIDGMNIGYAGSGKVKGYMLNQFSMDEYDGYFRVATTWNNENNLFILDSSLNVHGSVTGLAKGERIYSVRFMGDKGYIVTYRNMDPLFVFDLSDPKNPKVTGELKIPGFSNYLHPIGNNIILGIGMDTYDIFKKDAAGNDVVVGTRQGGIKLSLFDVSDMGKPKEISKFIIGDSGSYSEALNNHKAIMFDYTSQNLAFDATISNSEAGSQIRNGAFIFNFSENTLSLKGTLDFVQPEVYGMYIPYGRRVIYIGDELYYIQDGRITAYNYKTLAPIETLMLK